MRTSWKPSVGRSSSTSGTLISVETNTFSRDAARILRAICIWKTSCPSTRWGNWHSLLSK
jgi:hypothetical protein